MRLTEPIRLSLEDANATVSDMTAIRQSTLTMTPLGELRYGRVPHHECRNWLEARYRVGLREHFKSPRISGLGNDALGLNTTREEFLVVRDLDVESLDAVSETSSKETRRPRGRVVAYAELKYHPPADEISGSLVPQPDNNRGAVATSEVVEMPKAVHRALHDHWNNVVEEALRLEFEGMHCFEVRGLGTLSPSHLRKGIASNLLRWIFPFADHLNIPVVLAATPPGYLLYLRHGFEEIESKNAVLECNLKDWDGIGVHRHVLMIRQPKKKESSS